MNDYKFSVVISAYNAESNISKCIHSIINQTLKFEENIEIILINDGSIDLTGTLCEQFASLYPKNIKYISKRHEGNGVSRNFGISYSKGEYIYFLEGDDALSKNTLKNVLKFFEEHENVEIVSIPTDFNSHKKSEIIAKKYASTRVIDLLKLPNFFQPQIKSCFFRKTAIENIVFSNQPKLSEDIAFVNEILINNPYLGICSEAQYLAHNKRDENAILNVMPNLRNSASTEIKFHLNKLILESLIKYNFVPHFIQKTILYLFNSVILNDTIYEKLTPDEIRRINESIKEILPQISDENIYDQYDMDIKIKTFLLYLKNDYSYPEKDQFKLTKSLKLNTVFIDIYEIIDDELYILANINSISPEEKVDVYVNNKKIETSPVLFPQREKYYLNEKYLTNHTFEFRLKINPNKKIEIEFASTINQKLHIDFSRPCNFSKVVGYAKTKKYISHLENDKIIISKKTTGKWLKKEVKVLFNMLKNKVSGFETAIPIRIMYMALYPFLRNKRIWFYMDFPTIADDNGMHLFRYSINQDEKDIKKYFIVDKNTPYFDKMKKIGPVIPYHSIKHRVLGLFTEKIITSHPDNNYIYAFWGHYPNFAGLLKSSTIFLQHGITLNNISGWLNKYDKNLDFLLTASKKEYDSLFKYYYNYDEDIIQLLGFPRFDNLRDGKTKTILLMPSWRRYLDHENKYTISNSTYFKTYDSLINNRKLIEKAKEYGYTIIFRPHPHVYQFIDLFHENDYVKIDYERGSYQELFKKGAIMITDYSSVAFDFAYLKKPVIYYQSEDDYHFNLDESYFDYETMGFGEVCKDEDQLIELLIDYMENDCEMKEKHVKNVDDYFIFTDRNNCKRVHEAIKKIPPRE
ncbi:CDP-glycerol glycerophosphotransferase family protein [Methanobrevibacter sp.]|uniref:bifunctional glycosyltransferase/CDP-glycerol:glycerophosphate glycerophosphotransferase n=1 Tax=Methanobrevibacter sp. TaxID=66852 RepID=UPI00388F6497